jgi:hypothetical protein
VYEREQRTALPLKTYIVNLNLAIDKIRAAEGDADRARYRLLDEAIKPHTGRRDGEVHLAAQERSDARDAANPYFLLPKDELRKRRQSWRTPLGWLASPGLFPTPCKLKVLSCGPSVRFRPRARAEACARRARCACFEQNCFLHDSPLYTHRK